MEPRPKKWAAWPSHTAHGGELSLLIRLLESHLQAQPQGSLIQTVASGVCNLRDVHERAVLDVVGAGGAGLYRVAGSRMVRSIRNVKHFDEERKVPSLPEGE